MTADAMRERATTEDSWIGIISRYLAGKDENEPVCIMQILVEAIGMDKERVQKSDNMRVSNIITHHRRDWKRCPSNRVIQGYGSQRSFVKKTAKELAQERNGVQQCLPGV